MAVESGLAAGFVFDDIDLSGNIGQMRSMQMLVGQQDVTTLNKSARARNGTLRHGTFGWQGFFDDNADGGDGPHDKLAGIPSTADLVAVYMHRLTLGAPAMGMVSKQMMHSHNVGDGNLVVDVDVVANGYGLEGGEMLTAGVASSSGAEALASIDYGAAIGSTAFGLQAFLNVTAFTGTSATIAVQSSSDDGAGDAFADITGGVFTTVTAAGSERIQTSRTETIERYLRLNITGTYTALDFSVMVVKNLQTVNF